MLSTSEETLEHVFNQAVGKENAIDRVKKLRDYAFIHFKERDDAITAMTKMNGNCVSLCVCVCVCMCIHIHTYFHSPVLILGCILARFGIMNDLRKVQ